MSLLRERNAQTKGTLWKAFRRSLLASILIHSKAVFKKSFEDVVMSTTVFSKKVKEDFGFINSILQNQQRPESQTTDVRMRSKPQRPKLN